MTTHIDDIIDNLDNVTEIKPAPALVPSVAPSKPAKMTEAEIVRYLCSVMNLGGTVVFEPDNNGKVKITVSTPTVSTSYGARLVHENIESAVRAHRAAHESIRESTKNYR